MKDKETKFVIDTVLLIVAGLLVYALLEALIAGAK